MNARDIVLNLNGRWHGEYGTAPCPICQPEKRPDQAGLSLTESGGRLLAHCFKSGCDFRDVAKALNLPHDQLSAEPKARAALKAKRDQYAMQKLQRAKSLWDRAKPIAGSKAETYLRGRGIITALPSSLRFMPDLHHGPSCTWACAMIAKVEPMGAVHRTFLDKRKGAKLVKSPKMMLGSIQGGAVRLSEGVGPLLVGEGIESTLSALQAHGDTTARGWAALSTSGMKSLSLPLQVGELIIAGDNGQPGHDAANTLALRATSLGWRVSLWFPPSQFGDWNDALCGGLAA